MISKAFALGGAAVALTVSAVAAQAAPGSLKTFGTGDVTVTSPDSATIVNDAGEYGGVYLQSRSTSGKSLSSATFSFVSTGDAAGGAPRFSIPIDTDGNGSTDDGYAFLDVLGCGGTSGQTTTVSTSSASCHVNFAGVDYANWAAFAAANPSYRVAPGQIPFIIADQAGHYAVSSITLR